MVRTHPRSPSPEPSTGSSILKKPKTTHTPSPFSDPTPHFASNVLSAETVQKLHASYITSEPFKYAVVDKLFDDELLGKVKDECLRELSFTEKETDIYKVPSHLPLPNTLNINFWFYSPGEPNRRSSLSLFPNTRTNRFTTIPPHPTRCPLFPTIPLFPPVSNGLWTTLRYQTRYVREFLQKRLSSPQPR